MIGNVEALDYAENGIPDMLGTVSAETSEYYERFVNRFRYLVSKDIGCKPKYHKGIYSSKHDYYTCGNCGTTVRLGVGANYCDNCGFGILWDNPRCLTGIHESEDR